MVETLEATHKDHKTWKATMSAHPKEVSWLKIKLREEEWIEEFFKYATIVSRAWFITYNTRHLVTTSILSRDK